MTETEEVTIDPKDITYDILIDDTEERPDRDGGPAAAGRPAEEKDDHPVVTVLDMAMKHSGGYLEKQHLPPPNTDIYKDFSKPFLNEACWHYLPDGGLPDDPRVALALGVGGLALAFAPTLIALYERKEEEKKREEQEKKRRKQRREEPEGGDGEEERREPDPIPGPVAEPPDWMTRLESGMLGGM
ncbi:MAG: hypothetical protein PHD55_07820 [Methanoregula sp.]|nr:hypothetical protein [Methanoregula sp.]